MAGKRWGSDAEVRRRFEGYIARGLTQAQAAKAEGRSHPAMHNKASSLGIDWTAADGNRKSGSVRPDGPGISMDVRGDDAVLEVNTDTPCRTIADALKKAEVDPAEWQPVRSVVNSWEMGYKSHQPGKEVGKLPLWQVKVWLKRVVPSPVDAALERVAAAWRPMRLPAARRTRPRGVLAEICLYDAHFGMYAWGEETGQDHDIAIARRRYESAAADLLTRLESSHAPERIVLPVGSDFLHIDNPEGLTPKSGHRLDTDGRMQKVYESAFASVCTVVDLCRQLAPTEVLWVPGNHDPQTSYYLCHALAQRYGGNARVSVDHGPRVRKRIRHGVCLIGLTHGDEEPLRDLPTIMAAEWPEDWAATHHREMHIGHRHKKKETHTVTTDSFGPVRVRMIPPLCSTDYWHYRKGYVGGIRAAEAYLWHVSDGYLGHLSTAVLQRGAEA